jgi:hypothetical protein
MFESVHACGDLFAYSLQRTVSNAPTVARYLRCVANSSGVFLAHAVSCVVVAN